MTNPLQHPTYLHVLDDDVIAATTDRRPSQQRDQRQAKQILQQVSSETGSSVYDHMSALIKRILDERPANVMDHFEEFSRRVREEHFKQTDDRLQKTYIEPERLNAAHRIIPILTLPPTEDFPRGKIPSTEILADEEEEEEEQHEPFIRDIMHLQFFWSLAGYGFSAGQVYLLSCCMRKLEENPIVQNCRFWGQIYGLQQSYFIMEVDLTKEEIEKRVNMDNKIFEEMQNLNEKIEPEPITAVDLIPARPVIKGTRPPTAVLPVSLYQRPKDIPAEPIGSGVNRKTYFVCNILGEEWCELPNVTPEQLVVSRKITKYFTGDLNAKIWSYPKFHGVERHYLRATIARITASTYVSPTDYFHIDKSDEEEEEEEPNEEEIVKDNDKVTVPDPSYKPIPATELLNLESWTHHRSNILKQGRVNWFNPKDLEDNENEGEGEEEENEDEDDEKKTNEKPEVGPNLFEKCSKDCSAECIQPWTTKLSHEFNRSNDMVIIRSNLWPGAFSFAMQRVHDNLYVGWGKKFVKRNYSPQAIPRCEQEYPNGPEIMEISDPTVADEEAWRLAHEKPVPIVEEGEGEGEDEGEEEDEAEKDD